ncbi:MAG: response regulator [Deltaproteobacteria bacterium]|nr:response regulator [Deltaproteobacteria bacterium]
MRYLRVLMVEDDPDHAELAREALLREKDVGEVVRAESGYDCLKELAGNREFDLILLDYDLPGTDGLETLKKINKDGYDIPVIIVTGHGNEAVAAEAIKMGAYDYIVKTGSYLSIIAPVARKCIERHRIVGEKLALEAELVKQNLELEQKTRELGKARDKTEAALQDLKKTQQALVQTERLKIIGEMTGGIAHNFNNILAIILGKVDLLMLRHADNEPLIKDLGIIERAASDGAMIVRRMQVFDKGEKSRSLMNVDINEMVDNVIKATRPGWKDIPEHEGIQINIVHDRRKLPPVAGIPSELREIFINLILNAVDAMPHGGIITVETKTDRKLVSVKISDTGVGMSKEIKDRIFDPFFTTKHDRGSGLGLATSCEIIRRHNGEITVESAEGKGSSFIVTLPVSLSATGDVAKPVCVRSRTGRPAFQQETGKQGSDQAEGNILVIEDEEEIRDVIREALSGEGYRVKTAADGNEGMEIFRSDAPFDVVLTDMGLPGMSGLNVAQEIKEIYPQTPVILMTGWINKLKYSDNYKEKAVIDMLLIKPFQLKELIRAVREIKEKWQTEKQEFL